MATARSNTKTNGAAKDAAADLYARIEALRDDLDALAGSARKASGDVADEMRENAAERIEALLSAGEKFVADSRKTIARKGSEAEERIRDRPLAAVGLAVAAGFIAALALGRR